VLDAARLKPAASPCIYGTVTAIGTVDPGLRQANFGDSAVSFAASQMSSDHAPNDRRLKSGVFRWASDIYCFMLRERIETPRRVESP
jgi:hypothetical protein